MRPRGSWEPGARREEGGEGEEGGLGVIAPHQCSSTVERAQYNTGQRQHRDPPHLPVPNLALQGSAEGRESVCPGRRRLGDELDEADDLAGEEGGAAAATKTSGRSVRQHGLAIPLTDK